MSRFFRSREETSSEDEEEYSSEEYSDSKEESQYEESEESDIEGGSESSESQPSSEEDEEDKTHSLRGGYSFESSRRITKSVQQKYHEELRHLTNSINTGLASNNWVTVLKDFDNLVKSRATGPYPSHPYIRHVARTIAKLYECHESISSNKDLVKKFSPSVQKAISVIKQKIKRTESLFEADVKSWNENPVSESASIAEREELERQKALLKDEPRDDDQGEFIDKKDKKARRAHRQESATRRALQLKGESLTAEEKLSPHKKKIFEPKYDELFKHLEQILYERGKKGADKVEHVKQLEVLLKLAVKPEEKCQIFAAMIPARIDLSVASRSSSIQYWLKIVNELSEFMDILWSHDEIKVQPTSEKEALIEGVARPAANHIVYCSITTYIKGVHKEFIRSLQEIDPKTVEYISRMKHEAILYILTTRLQKYFERKGDKDQAAYSALRRLKYIYYKQNELICVLEKKLREARPELADCLEPSDKVVECLSLILSKSPNERIKTHSFLAYVYNLALNDKLYEARNLMLMSHIQNNIHKADTSAQILYNRTIVQIGLCAFRNSMIKMAVSSLYEIMYSGHSRELLAQGNPQQKSFDRARKKVESQRTLPYFMHLNIELMECVYLTCSMLIEVPAMVMGTHEPGRRIMSRQFCRMIEYNERQVFVGPPENVRDHITAASIALAAGDWKKCRDYTHGIKLWDLMPSPDAIKDIITQKIKEESIRTYLFTYSSGYKTIDINALSEYFETPIPKIKTIASRMIVSDEVDAYIDEKANMIVFGRGSKQEITKLQHLALMYSEKLAAAVENNEKVIEVLTLNVAGSHRDNRDKAAGFMSHGIGGGARRDNRSGQGHGVQGRYRDRDGQGGGQGMRPYRPSHYAH